MYVKYIELLLEPQEQLTVSNFMKFCKLQTSKKHPNKSVALLKVVQCTVVFMIHFAQARVGNGLVIYGSYVLG